LYPHDVASSGSIALFLGVPPDSISARPPTRVVPVPAVVSVADAATMLGISRAFAYELVARGTLTHIRLGRRIVIPRWAIESMIAGASQTDSQLDDSAGAPSR